MKTEEILRYEAEYRVIQKVLGTFLLVFELPDEEVPTRSMRRSSPNPRATLEDRTMRADQHAPSP